MLDEYRKLLKKPDGPFSRLITKPIELICLPLVVRLPIHPNVWTILSFGMKLFAAWWIVSEKPWGYVSLWLALALILDGFDGDVARWRKQKSYFGACLDTYTDIVGGAAILTAFLYRAAPTLPYAALSCLAAVTGEILYQTFWVWISITGVILKDHVRLAAWDRTLREKGYLCLYFIDSYYFILAIGPLVTNLQTTFFIQQAACWGSFLYLISIHHRACRYAPDGYRAWDGLKRLLIHRIAGIFLSLLTFFLLPFMVWLEYLLFYIPAVRLMKLSSKMPEDPAAREAFLADLKRKDWEFLDRIWP